MKENGEIMWRITGGAAERVEAFVPVLEARLQVRLSRTQVCNWLINRALDAEGAPPAPATEPTAE